jgi:Family of unknown function (DUF5947)
MERTLNGLSRFVRSRVPVERCDLCSREVGEHHPHLLEPATRQIHCSCDACGILFSNAADGRYKRIPRDIKYLPNFLMSDLRWAALMLPIELAFFFYSTPDSRLIALYPSPAGAMESTLELEAWGEIREDNPVLLKLEPDVEALLVNRVSGKREYYIAPIDECYKLVGLIRAKWHGLSGGTEAWKAIDDFFASLKQRAPVPEGAEVCQT